MVQTAPRDGNKGDKEMKKAKTVKYTKNVLSMSEGDRTNALRRVLIMRDKSPLNPRVEYDNVFTLVSGCPRYFDSDKGALNPVVDYGRNPAEAKFMPGVCVFPFYAYIHGGIALSMSAFADKWDSGCAGFIYVNRADFCREFGLKRFSRKRAYEIAKGEIETFDQYLNGEVFGYVEQTRATVEAAWTDGDSCWGYFGEESIPSMLSDACAYEEGTVICVDDDAYICASEVTMEIAVPEQKNTSKKAA